MHLFAELLSEPCLPWAFAFNLWANVAHTQQLLVWRLLSSYCAFPLGWKLLIGTTWISAFRLRSSEILTSEYNLKAPLSPARISNVGGQYIPSTSEEQRQYQETWKTAYFFVKHRGSPTCLICTEKVTMHMNATSDVITQQDMLISMQNTRERRERNRVPILKYVF